MIFAAIPLAPLENFFTIKFSSAPGEERHMFAGVSASTTNLFCRSKNASLSPARMDSLSCGCRIFYLLHFLSSPALRLLPGAGGRSPPRRGAWGERGRRPSTPPAPPYSPFCGNAKIVSLAGLYPVRRVSRGASARTFPGPMGRGDVRACCGAPFALRASGIAFAPAPSLHQDRGRRG